MKMRTKSIISTFIISALIFLALHFVSVFIITPSFTVLDKEENNQSINQAMTTLNYRLTQVEENVVDYSNWDDTYNFVKGNNPDYIGTNFVDSTFETLKLNLVIIFDNSKNVVYFQEYDLNNSAKIQSSQQNEQLLTQIFSLTQNTSSGMILVDNQPMMMAVSPILTSTREGPAVGEMLFGKYLDGPEITKLESITNLNFEIHLTSQFINSNPQTGNSLLANPQMNIITEDSKTISGYFIIKDVYYNPVLVLQIQTERTAYQQALWVEYIFLSASIGLSFVLGAVILLMLERGIINPPKKNVCIS